MKKNLRFSVMVIGILVLIMIACSQSALSPPPPPTPNPATRIEDLRTRMENRADYNKYVIDEDTMVWFIPCEPSPAAWAAAMILFHLPSTSDVHLNNDGSIKTSIETNYFTNEARTRLDAVLANEALMSDIVAKYRAPDRCPLEYR